MSGTGPAVDGGARFLLLLLRASGVREIRGLKPYEVDLIYNGGPKKGLMRKNMRTGLKLETRP